ncbi:MAG: hypothetical protein EBT15_11805 [Betaproteobacteria bacterium]|nr:hypothetical protein [Betaproteobacteria bacterium]
MPDTVPVITFSNESVLAWLSDKGINGDRREYVRPDEILHRHVYGHLPYWLASYADSVSELTMPKLDRDDRERFNRGLMTVQEMDAAGAHIVTYRVRRA